MQSAYVGLSKVVGEYDRVAFMFKPPSSAGLLTDENVHVDLILPGPTKKEYRSGLPTTSAQWRTVLLIIGVCV